jgi:hypothetical protein
VPERGSFDIENASDKSKRYEFPVIQLAAGFMKHGVKRCVLRNTNLIILFGIRIVTVFCTCLQKG